jgi:hypothetical protein
MGLDIIVPSLCNNRISLKVARLITIVAQQAPAKLHLTRAKCIVDD